MSKSHERELSRLFACILADIAAAYPALRDDLEKDLWHLARHVAQRGISIYVADLPAAGKHLDRCLSVGQYHPSALPLVKRCTDSIPYPRFLRGLYELVFDVTGKLKEDYNVEAVYFLRQCLYIGKKCKLPCNREALRTEVREFFAVDSQLPIPDSFWYSEAPTLEEIQAATPGWASSARYSSRVETYAAPLREQLLTLLRNLDLVSGFLATTLNRYEPDEWRFNHGPGAVSEVVGPYNKYCFTNWSNALETVYPIADCGYHSWNSWAGATDHARIGSQEPHSRLVAVHKTFLKPRLIAVEPSEHMWCQQNLLDFMYSRARRSWIGQFVRFNDQTRNQELCLRGSVDGRLITVDLSAASDRVSCHAVAQLFRKNIGVLRALRASRTMVCEQKYLHDVSRLVPLRKFSTMGNACTFPVESFMFLAVTLAAILTQRKLRVTEENILSLKEEVAVYGDDIVAPVDSRELLCSALEVLDFKVNTDKSFWTGKFRESCGVDALDGVVITPVFWTTLLSKRPESVASNLDVANNFYKKFMLRTAGYLASTVQARHRMPLVAMDSGVRGLTSFVRPSSPGTKIRWRASLQRWETLVPLLLARVEVTPVSDDSAILQYFTEDPDPLKKWKSGYRQRPVVAIRRSWVPLDDLQLKKI